jgi:NAD(P)-dependent dehydrogenase (short-subunit alcohol dehydrogenase family)
MSLHNRVALITGAAGGIGKAIAFAFGAAGARVFLSGTSTQKLTDLAALKAEGVETAYRGLTSGSAPRRTCG